MCEMLVRVKDQISDDPVNNARLSKRGDVIVVMPDGWNWGTLEKSHDFWRILLCPDMDVLSASVLTSPQKAVDPLQPSPMLQFRQNRLNLDDPTLPSAVQAYLADDTRAQHAMLWPSTATPVTALATATPMLADPTVIGGSTTVIG